MKRWIASVVTLMGALGLVMFGDDLVGVMLVINAQPGETLADITDVRWSIMSAMALLIGLILSSLAPAKPTNSPVGKRLLVLSGVLLFCGALPLAWGMSNAIQSYNVIATSATTTAAAELLEAVDYSKFIMTVGYLLFLGSAVLLLVESSLCLGDRTSSTELKPAVLNSKFSLVSMILCIGLLIVSVFTCLHSQALDGMLPYSDEPPQAADLSGSIWGILNKSFIIFAGLAIIGLLQILKAACTPAVIAKSDLSD